MVGVETNLFFAMLGAAGLAVGLAFQGVWRILPEAALFYFLGRLKLGI